jgi:uncharacterized SAM-binding protein YcdF (DUF218 family)
VTVLVDWAKGALRISSGPFIVVILLIGVALLLVRPRWGRRWVIGFAIAFWFCSTPLGSRLLAFPLARGFHPIDDRREAEGVGAIVVLGGGSFEVTAGPVRLGYPTAETALRIAEGVRVFRLLGSQPLMVASGGNPRTGQSVPEGDVIAAGIAQLEVPSDRVLVDALSLTTREQAIAVTQLLRARGIRRFVLVTSPTHMLRAVLVFRAHGADVVPSAAPFGSIGIAGTRFFMPNGESLRLSDVSLYDYASTAYYWAHGWFRPAPGALTR